MNAFDSARIAFSQTVRLKLQLFHEFVPKGSNSAVAGAFIEALVREFVRHWIAPCQLLPGTMHPFDSNAECKDHSVPQIDGIVFDPRQGPPIIREGDFIVAHPSFCPGIIEVKKSESNIRGLNERLDRLYAQYYRNLTTVNACFSNVMGIVIHDPDPEAHSHPDWIKSNESLYKVRSGSSCPIFILFKEVTPGSEYEPYAPAIDAMISTIFDRGWAFDPRLPRYQSEVEIRDELYKASLRAASGY